MSISRLQASLAQATNEVTVAAANINFDFCLVKYEAPKEYHPIGKLLSNKRKQDAEHGASHATARRLAALFDGVCPSTPNLITAYGTRVSEISQKATDMESQEHSKSIFGLYTGVDATSIWAAATSSPGSKASAIHVHLLACMLSSVFKAAEAISIWVELVEERRKAIAQSWQRDEQIPFASAAAAAQQEITRGQLADWDASARAWLQTADAVMRNKQTQLRLILKNINMSMGSETVVLISVIDKWVQALNTMERLITGVPQEVQDGSAIIGLAAWHIYPNIEVFGSRNVEVHMDDPLVSPGGVLTLGCSPSATSHSSGVSWSLSLAQYKYYGQPVRREGNFKPDPTKITFKELMLATLGAVLHRWDVPTNQTATMEALEFIDILSAQASDIKDVELLSAEFNQKIEGLRLLFEATMEWSKNDEPSLSLINLGRNRADFIPSSSKIPKEAGANGVNPPFEQGEPPAKKQSVNCHARWLLHYSGETETPKEIIYKNHDYSIYAPDIRPNVVNRNPRDERQRIPMAQWFGDRNKAAIFVAVNPAIIYVSGDTSVAHLPVPRITEEDILWCLQYEYLAPRKILELDDSISKTLQYLAMAYTGAFKTIKGPVIQVQTLEKPLLGANCLKNVRNAHEQQQIKISILAYFVAGHDIQHVRIPNNIVGISFGDSIFVPHRLLHDPLMLSDPQAFVRILGNIGKPGFVMFFSVLDPMTSQLDPSFWRVVNPRHFDGMAVNLFQNTSMHLSFTNWERPLERYESTGDRDVQTFLMESVISIREKGVWIGDVDVMAALESPHIYRLPEQEPCNHPKPAKPDSNMASIESWDELREIRSGIVVVRANGNWLARLATTAYVAQCAQKERGNARRITLCPPSVCWTCLEPYIRQFPTNIFVY
ncbi:hypothetical protein E8E14_013357 [Neopestalotiopsis sp. 37M]|nr:hypothetical protein E8E14_013357 [Neopestalotiopsis sp. 37M]